MHFFLTIKTLDVGARPEGQDLVAHFCTSSALKLAEEIIEGLKASKMFQFSRQTLATYSRPVGFFNYPISTSFSGACRAAGDVGHNMELKGPYFDDEDTPIETVWKLSGSYAILSLVAISNQVSDLDATLRNCIKFAMVSSVLFPDRKKISSDSSCPTAIDLTYRVAEYGRVGAESTEKAENFLKVLLERKEQSILHDIILVWGREATSSRKENAEQELKAAEDRSKAEAKAKVSPKSPNSSGLI